MSAVVIEWHAGRCAFNVCRRLGTCAVEPRLQTQLAHYTHLHTTQQTPHTILYTVSSASTRSSSSFASSLPTICDKHLYTDACQCYAISFFVGGQTIKQIDFSSTALIIIMYTGILWSWLWALLFFIAFYYSRPSGVCRYGRLLCSAHVFLLFLFNE